MNPRTPFLQSIMEVETLHFGTVSLLKVQTDFASLKGQWTGPCIVKSWMTTFFPQPEHRRWVMDESSSMTMTLKIGEATKEWLKKKHIKVLASL